MRHRLGSRDSEEGGGFFQEKVVLLSWYSGPVHLSLSQDALEPETVLPPPLAARQPPCYTADAGHHKSLRVNMEPSTSARLYTLCCAVRSVFSSGCQPHPPFTLPLPPQHLDYVVNATGSALLRTLTQCPLWRVRGQVSWRRRDMVTVTVV